VRLRLIRDYNFVAMVGKEDPCHASYTPRLEWNPQVFDYLSQAYGAEHFANISQALTRPSIHSCVRVNTLQRNTTEVIQQLTTHLLHKQTHLQGSRAEHIDNNEEPLKVLEETDAMKSFPEDTRPKELTTTENKLSSSQNICFEHDVLKDVVMVKGKGPRQIDYETVRGEGGVLKEIVVSRKCAEAVLRGAQVFVPGVLACSGHIEKDELVAVSVAVERPDGEGRWLVGVTRGTTLGTEHAKSQFEDTARSGWFIGIGRALMTRASLFRETKGVAVEMVNRVFDLPAFSGVLTGDIFLQNLPSIVAARVLDPKPGERILDMCAAPGGKTTAIAMLMQDKGEVIALDRSHNKVADIVRLGEELKLTCIQAIKMDALKSVQVEMPQPEASQVNQGNLLAVDTTDMASDISRSGNMDKNSDSITAHHQNLEGVHEPVDAELQRTSNEGIGSSKPCEVSGEKPCKIEIASKKRGNDDGAYASRRAARKEARKLKTGLKKAAEQESPYKRGFVPRSFDHVLLDAPCSALGLRPRLFAGLETLDGLRQHANYQRRLMDQAVQLVRPGGTLVYSTCTLNPGENEGVVRYALDTYSFLSLVPQHPKIGGPGLVGGDDVFDGATYRPWLRDGEQHLVQRFDPVGASDTIGFFIAKFLVSP